jgi:hypothetical protein
MRRDEDFGTGDFEATRRLLDAAEALPRSVEPEHDLWPRIAERIRAGEDVLGDDARASAAGRRRGWRSEWGRGLLAAAAVLVLFAVGYVTGVLKPLGDRGEVGREESAAGSPDGSPSQISAFEGRTAASLVDWTAADDALVQLLAERSGELDPETITLVRRNLEIIDAAIGEIRAALDDDPENPELERLLHTGYRRRGALILRAADYAGSI